MIGSLKVFKKNIPSYIVVWFSLFPTFSSAQINLGLEKKEMEEKSKITPELRAQISKASKASIDNLMLHIAEEVNLSAPQKIFDGTDILGAVYDVKSRTITMHGSAHPIASEEDLKKRSLEAKKAFCSVEMNRLLVAKGVTYRYRYSQGNGMPFERIVTKKDCDI